jgi:hypothetical protein
MSLRLVAGRRLMSRRLVPGRGLLSGWRRWRGSGWNGHGWLPYWSASGSPSWPITGSVTPIRTVRAAGPLVDRGMPVAVLVVVAAVLFTPGLPAPARGASR